MEILKQIKKLGDMKKFSFGELTSDITGKTSPSAFVGMIISLVGCSVFVYASIIKQLEFVSQAVVVIGLGTGLLATNKVMNGKPQMEDIPVEQK